MANGDKDRPSWLRFSGIGIEFAAAVAGFTMVGWWVDRHWNCRPWGLLIGVVLGLTGGMYNMIRQALGAFKPPGDRGPRQRSSKP
jgi:F0F1-type ATP synthase assembly protein I